MTDSQALALIAATLQSGGPHSMKDRPATGKPTFGQSAIEDARYLLNLAKLETR